MSKKHGAKGLRQSDLDEAEEMRREAHEYEASLPSHMDESRAGGDFDYSF